MKPLLILAGLIFPTQAVWGGASANYTLEPDAVDNGGLRSASTDYTANFSNMPGGAGSAANYNARTGFAGQVQDAVAIELAAVPLTVNEGGTRQLSANLIFDDYSTTPLAASSITWSVQSGPLTSIDTGGRAIAGNVYQDTLATVSGTYQSFTDTLDLSVINILPDNFGTYGGDGIEDGWQVQYFGLNNPLAGPLRDADHDGWNNLFEYRACLIPTDPLSVFSFSITETVGGGHAITFSPRFPGCTYTVQGSSNLALWAPVTGAITDAGTVRTLLDPAGHGERLFYFIEVQRP
jgi:hypothetical protein